VGPETECLGVTFEVARHLLVAGVVRVIGRHRKVGELHAISRRVDAKRAVDAALLVVVIEDQLRPPRPLLETDGRKPASSKAFKTVRPDDPAPITAVVIAIPANPSAELGLVGRGPAHKPGRRPTDPRDRRSGSNYGCRTHDRPPCHKCSRKKGGMVC